MSIDYFQCLFFLSKSSRGKKDFSMFVFFFNSFFFFASFCMIATTSFDIYIYRSDDVQQRGDSNETGQQINGDRFWRQ